MILTDEQEMIDQRITWLAMESITRSAMNGGRLELLLSQMDADDAAEENYPQYEHMFAEVRERIWDIHAEIDEREAQAPCGYSDSDFNDGCIVSLQAELAPLIAARIAQRMWDRDRKSAKYQKAFDDNYAAWDGIKFPLPESDADRRQRDWMMEAAG